jgi:predicted DNA-binding protein YlxM (UPF0122 family)
MNKEELKAHTFSISKRQLDIINFYNEKNKSVALREMVDEFEVYRSIVHRQTRRLKKMVAVAYDETISFYQLKEKDSKRARACLDKINDFDIYVSVLGFEYNDLKIVFGGENDLVFRINFITNARGDLQSRVKNQRH